MIEFIFDKGTQFERHINATSYGEASGDNKRLHLEYHIEITPETEFPDITPFIENRTVTTVEAETTSGVPVPVTGSYNRIRNIDTNITDDSYELTMVLIEVDEEK